MFGYKVCLFCNNQDSTKQDLKTDVCHSLKNRSVDSTPFLRVTSTPKK